MVKENQRGIETIEWIAIAAVILVLLLGMIAVFTPAGRELATSIFDKTSEWIARWSGEKGASSGTALAPPGMTGAPKDPLSITGPSTGIGSLLNIWLNPDEGIGAPGTVPGLETINPKGPYRYEDLTGQWRIYLDPETNKYVIEGQSIEGTVTETRERTVKEYPGWTDWFLVKWAKDKGWLDWTAKEKTETYTEQRTAFFRPSLEGYIGSDNLSLGAEEVDDETWRVEGEIKDIDQGAIVRGKDGNGGTLFEVDPTLELGRQPIGDLMETSPFGPRWGGTHDGRDVKSSSGNTEVHVPIEGKITRYQKDGTDGFWTLEKDGNTVTVSKKAERNRLVNNGYTVIEEHDNGPGYILVVDHGMLYDSSQKKFVHVETVYVHTLLNSDFKVGDTIKPDDVLGNYAKIGFSTGPHLHYGVHIDGQAVDPDPAKNPAIYGGE